MTRVDLAASGWIELREKNQAMDSPASEVKHIFILNKGYFIKYSLNIIYITLIFIHSYDITLILP